MYIIQWDFKQYPLRRGTSECMFQFLHSSPEVRAFLYSPSLQADS